MDGPNREQGVAGEAASLSELEILKAEVLKSIARALESQADNRTSVVEFYEHRGVAFYEEVAKFEIELIRQALAHTKGNQRAAARLLGLKPATLNSKIRAYKLGAVPDES
jgi:DNA-binding NtrC family response regulator